jgi:hypothetical protein
VPDLSTLSGRLLTQELGSEDSTILFTSARREAAIFDAIREFADLTECNIRVSSLTVVGGTAEYDLHNSSIVTSQDFVRFANDQPVELHYTDASSITSYHHLTERTVRWLDYHDPEWRGSTISSGMQVPEVFYRRTDGGHQYLGFHPQPSTGSSAAMQALIPYVAYPHVSTASTHVPFTDTSGFTRWDLRPYHQGLVHYAAHQLEKLRKDYQASDRQLQKFLGYVQRYLQSLRKKGGSTVSFVRNHFSSRTPPAEDPRT